MNLYHIVFIALLYAFALWRLVIGTIFPFVFYYKDNNLIKAKLTKLEQIKTILVLIAPFLFFLLFYFFLKVYVTPLFQIEIMFGILLMLFALLLASMDFIPYGKPIVLPDKERGLRTISKKQKSERTIILLTCILFGVSSILIGFKSVFIANWY